MREETMECIFKMVRGWKSFNFVIYEIDGDYLGKLDASLRDAILSKIDVSFCLEQHSQAMKALIVVLKLQ